MSSSNLFRNIAWLAVTCFALSMPFEAQAQKEQGAADKAVKSRGGGAAQDPNIKNNSDVNKEEDAKVEPPPNKGGPKTRQLGGICQVHGDNRTNWFIRIYIDGVYRGTIGRYGDLNLGVYSGATRLFGRALFDDGSNRDWGPRVFNCQDGGAYTWTLNQ